MSQTSPTGASGGTTTRGASTGAVASTGTLATTGSALETPQGRTTIADTVVSKIAGIAARDVLGVHSLGGGGTRAVAAIRERIPGGRTNFSQGVAVEVGNRQAAVDVDVVADYGIAIADLAAGIRENVITAVERMTGLEVTEVNIVVHDVYVAGDDDGSEPPHPSRVQ
jgi:uncharacterized alkaline shock family protein YloU